MHTNSDTWNGDDIMEDKKLDDGTVIIGNKPFRSYKIFLLNLLSKLPANKIKIEARGKSNIYKALSLIEVIKRYNKIEPIITSRTDVMEDKGNKKNVTAIEIKLEK